MKNPRRSTFRVAALAAAIAAAGCEGRAPRSAERGPADHAQAPEAPTTASTGARSSTLDGPSVAEIDLSHGVPEARGASLLGSSGHRSHVDLVRSLRALAEG